MQTSGVYPAFTKFRRTFSGATEKDRLSYTFSATGRFIREAVNLAGRIAIAFIADVQIGMGIEPNAFGLGVLLFAEFDEVYDGAIGLHDQ
jgi:hypothetical protein